MRLVSNSWRGAGACGSQGAQSPRGGGGPATGARRAARRSGWGCSRARRRPRSALNFMYPSLTNPGRYHYAPGFRGATHVWFGGAASWSGREMSARAPLLGERRGPVCDVPRPGYRRRSDGVVYGTAARRSRLATRLIDCGVQCSAAGAGASADQHLSSNLSSLYFTEYSISCAMVLKLSPSCWAFFPIAARFFFCFQIRFFRKSIR